MRIISIVMSIMSIVGELSGQIIDDHGCLANMGYGWCDKLNACINPALTECNLSSDIATRCSPTFVDCDSEYVCPKVEVLDCEGGKAGYTRYRLSVILKEQVENVYVIYGGKGGLETNQAVDMIVPPAYNVNGPYSSDIGGINPFFYIYNEELMYDSWLTIGITDGDPHNLLSTIGIDYSEWDIDHGLDISDGALFVMDPLVNVIDGNEYVIGQLTLSDESELNVELNIQGKFKDTSLGNHWDEKGVTFRVEPPEKIPNDCMIWFNGCKNCLVRDGINTGECSDEHCERNSRKRCIRFNSGH